MSIAVIGGGAAGLMAAYTAASAGARVTLYERNEKIGKKIYITGKGRCNVTNACTPEEFIENTVRNPKFMYSAIYSFTPDDLQELLQSTGLKLKVERGRRVFPVSDKSSDVIKALAALIKKAGVKVELNSRVEGITPVESGGFDVKVSGSTLHFDKVIIATGGKSYPLTGSTGDGHVFAEKCGISVKETYPALVPIVVRERHIAEELQGLSLKNVELSVLRGKRSLYCERGEMLFTHFGVSGPIALSASSYISGASQDGLRIEINMKPALSEKQLDDRIRRDLEANSGKQLKNSLNALLPQRMINAVIAKSGVPADKFAHTVSREERAALAKAVSAFDLTVTGLGTMKEAIITRGGVAVNEIDPSTMECKKISGLFFAGELVDVDCLTGGYNLQAAFSMGRLAGLAASGQH